MEKLILASSSKPRAKILEDLGVCYLIHPSDFDESKITISDPKALVEKLASLKAATVALQFPCDFVIGCDSVFWFNESIIGKQSNPDTAFEVLLSMRNKQSICYTGYSLYHKDRSFSCCASTTVTFRDFSSEEAKAYIQTGEHKNGAGGIMVSRLGAILVSSFSGSFYNVVGLCPSVLSQALSFYGKSLFNFLEQH